VARYPLTTALAVVLAAVPATPPLAAHPGSPPRIVVVLARDSDAYRRTLQGFEESLGKEASSHLKTLRLERPRSLTPSDLLLPGESPADLVLIIGARPADVFQGRIPRLPMLSAAVSGLVIGPGGDQGPPIPDVTTDVPYALQFQTLMGIAPRIRNVGVIYESSKRPAIQEAAAAARTAGLQLIPAEIHSVSEIPQALQQLLGRVDALWAIPDPVVFSQETSGYIILETLRQRKPFMSFSENFVKAGSLLALYCDFEDLGRQAGGLARELLDGTTPAGGVVAPRKALLAINLRVAEVIGLEVSSETRRRATVLYE
jgi:ABC-type uncharacterized transport system substrate-binding protein